MPLATLGYCIFDPLRPMDLGYMNERQAGPGALGAERYQKPKACHYSASKGGTPLASIEAQPN